MTTNYHTDIAAGAAASAATLNAPLGQLDAKLNLTVVEYANTGSTATTVTTAATWYAITAHEVSFTPAYTGQVFTIQLWVSDFWSTTAGTSQVMCRITDGAGTTVQDSFIRASNVATAAVDAPMISGTRSWTAGAGDVGVTRKAKLYVTHTVNAAVVNVQYLALQVVSH